MVLKIALLAMMVMLVTPASANIPVPHAAPLPFTLTEGKEITIDGVAGNGDGFSVNLSDSPNMEGTIALHFNPRFNQHEVVRTHQAGGWGQEEKHGGFPFKRGQAFQIKIVTRNHAFQIFVNNNFFADFNHRIAKESVRFVFITGDVQLSRINFVYGVVYNPPVPLTSPVPGGVHPGRMVIINGVATADEFSINLMCGPSFEGSDIALHLAVRMGASSVVRNHRQGGGWGEEETHKPFFPFAPNVPFEVTVLCEAHGYKIAVNNQHFAEFHHRIHPLHRADHLHVRGDVRVTQVRFV